MKSCPRCRGTYPDGFSVCPQDGCALEQLRDWQPGDLIREKYKIIRKIGQGGMGAIYQAEHLIFSEFRALKVLKPQLTHDEFLARHLEQEARITRRLNHPNAVRVEDVDRAEDGRLFIALEYVEGKSMGELIRDAGPMPVPRVVEIARQLCSALDTAHSLGMVHRDIKPDNVLLVRQPGDRDLVKVLDFGIAKIRESTMEHGRPISGVTSTKTGFVVGTPQYVSPEQAMGTPGNQLDGRSDIYSAGVLMFEALTGQLPFKADTPIGYLLHHAHSVPPSPLDLNPDLNVAQPVVEIVMKALQKDPARRYQSAREMILALTAAAESFQRSTLIGVTRDSQVKKPPIPAEHGTPLPAPVPGEPGAGPAPPSAGVPPISEHGLQPGSERSRRAAKPVEAKRAPSRRWTAFLLRIRSTLHSKLASSHGVRTSVVVFLALLSICSVIMLGIRIEGVLKPKWRPTQATGGGVLSTQPEPSQPPAPAPKTSAKPPQTSSSPAIRSVPATKNKAPTETEVRRVEAGTKHDIRRELSMAQQKELRSNLAVAKFFMDHNDYDSAITSYREALKIDPSNGPAQDGLRKAYQLRDTLKSIIK